MDTSLPCFGAPVLHRGLCRCDSWFSASGPPAATVTLEWQVMRSPRSLVQRLGEVFTLLESGHVSLFYSNESAQIQEEAFFFDTDEVDTDLYKVILITRIVNCVTLHPFQAAPLAAFRARVWVGRFLSVLWNSFSIFPWKTTGVLSECLRTFFFSQSSHKFLTGMRSWFRFSTCSCLHSPKAKSL